MQESTIAAIATPLGEGGIGVVRISGKLAKAVADSIFRSASGKKVSEAAGYTALYGNVVNDGQIVDEVIALVFTSPKSYTGEDTVEISAHGGPYVVKQVLRAALQNGARPAEAGEFTKRAFLNGKMDLTQAESVMGIISATGKQALQASVTARDGAVSQTINSIKEQLLEAASRVAAFSDFPDEDLEFSGIDMLGILIEGAKLKLESLLKNYDAGRVLREGINTVIIGKPNVGKSTLMNLLTGCERSIVTSVAGTTRDVVEETVMLGDIKLRLADTAGLHETEDEVEKIGVERAIQRMEAAQLIIAVFDSSSPLTEQDKQLIETAKDHPTVAVLNKSDLDIVIDEKWFKDKNIPTVTISAKNREGTEQLQMEIEKLVGINNLNADMAVMSSERQRECAAKAYDLLIQATEILNMGMTFDAVGVIIDDALASLMELTGERVTVEVANEVFKRFCVGK
ncbi:MAG: tRNA uridine-5-carboxymethylaminomethyl(34) synthesis GTPase MnmE [Oscillospiraceae bacterium]|nr:tRNA uridine-5-carboxymethylaminomethyl(34) synthesis GTPase MnmE [Oscillospiraceae bacterium]